MKIVLKDINVMECTSNIALRVLKVKMEFVIYVEIINTVLKIMKRVGNV